MRYTFLFKAKLIEAARGSPRAREIVMREHGISELEMQSWERHYDERGAKGLKVTKLPRKIRSKRWQAH